MKKFDNPNKITCPRYIDGECIDAECKDTYSEKWTICPFHQGMSLEPSTSRIYDVKIDTLNVSDKMIRRLNEANIKTLFDIMDAGVKGLVEVPYIGYIRANNIYYTTREYIDDNF
ncbi:helix-hairpin-helix domain-containing protein [Natroniella acetigena]|uniref:helix-hairpin-helix domain-containing protein n=1 Tax=Natroniella acetigena TaxID=52004 RepID=UPI00200B4DE7|nr:helix-hairpin-helix domain-containing protein [Natroniella acetigena]MCK8828251.1 helix-hairpin-helix domain-containing protein [Natroniella acetigena]